VQNNDSWARSRSAQGFAHGDHADTLETGHGRQGIESGFVRIEGRAGGGGKGGGGGGGGVG